MFSLVCVILFREGAQMVQGGQVVHGLRGPVVFGGGGVPSGPWSGLEGLGGP